MRTMTRFGNRMRERKVVVSACIILAFLDPSSSTNPTLLLHDVFKDISEHIC